MVKLSKNKIIPLILYVILAELLLYPIPSMASGKNNYSAETMESSLKITNIKDVYHLPNNNERSVKLISFHIVTAYNSLSAQTDNSPCITASGFNVCRHNIEDTVAANFLPLGSKIRIPEYFGNKVFVVRDRMNRRHKYRIDVWMKSHQNAIDFGKKNTLIEVLE